MKYIVILFLMAGFTGLAQEEKSKSQIRKEERAAKKEKKKQKDIEAVARINEFVESKQWVLEANTVRGRRGGQVFGLNATLNFLSVNGEEEATIQLAFNNLVGWNGVGGITLNGRLTRYDFTPAKKEGQGAKLRASFIGPGGNADIFLTVSAYQSNVTISGNWGERITLIGEIKHPSESKVYKGMSRFGN